MWFYRESSLFEGRDLSVPQVPDDLYAFPSWPGMRSVPAAELANSASPSEFWNEFVVPHKAVVIRKALEGSAALAHWGDEEYLLSHFGDLEAKIETRLEARGDAQMGKPVRSGRATVREIVGKKIDGYVVSVVPQPMAWDVSVPRCVLCGKRTRSYLDLSPQFEFMTELEETSLWISRGKTRSQFHYDKENTFNCLVTGAPKQWVLLDTRKYASVLPWTRGGGYNSTNDLENLYTDWVGVDVDNLDLNLHAYLLEAEFEVLTQYPGDCVFLPFSMLHYAGHLVTDDTLQVAVSYMWLPGVAFKPDCQVPEPLTTVPLATFDTVWYYSGFGAIPQGHHDPRRLQQHLVVTDENGQQTCSMVAVAGFLPPGTRSTDKGLEDVLWYVQLIARMVEKNLEVPLDVWLQLSTAVDMNSLGCNGGMRYIPRPLEEMNRMLTHLMSG